jgi:NAD(P)-dependent dehydrogenase (short-subunit alcohol dehydrogenase family)
MTMNDRSLQGSVALVAGATRGCGRAIAVELGARGATVYCSGRSSREAGPSPMGRSETIEDSAELVDAAGGTGIAARTDHNDSGAVAALVERIAREQDGRLDIVVNDVWGGDPLVAWANRLWEHDLAAGLKVVRNAIDTHLITSHHALKSMVARGSGLVVEVGDGKPGVPYRGNAFYDLAKEGVNTLARIQAAELRGTGVTAIGVTPGFLRSEAMLDNFGVTEENWRDAVTGDGWFAYSETPHLLGRGLAALAADPDRARFHGQVLGSWDLMHEYGFTDLDGAQPDWGAVDAQARAGVAEEGHPGAAPADS